MSKNPMETHDPLPVKGYRAQGTTVVETVNANKDNEERLLRLLDRLEREGNADPRWLALARTQLEQGFMALNRAILQPERVQLPEDR